MVDRLNDATAEALSRRKRRIFAWVCGAILVATLYAFQSVLRPFVLGALLAYVLDPVVNALARVRVAGRVLPRWAAVLVIYVGLLTSLVLGITAVTPRVVLEVRAFATHEVPELRRRAERVWVPAVQGFAGRIQGALGDRPRDDRGAPGPDDDDEPDDNAVRIESAQGGGWRVVLPTDGVQVERIDDTRFRVVAPRPRRAGETEEAGNIVKQLRAIGAGHLSDIVRVGGGIIGGVIGGIFGFFMTLMVSAYMLVTEAQIFGFFRGLVEPSARPGFDALLDRLDRGLKGVVRGQLIICMVNGALSAVGFTIAGLKYGPTLALVATVFSLVPIFGSILSSIPAVAIGLTQSFGTGLFVLLWILGIHQLEANLLNPKIMGDAAKIHPVLVVFSLLAGEHFFGIQGALLAVPAMSIAQSLFLHWRAYALDWVDASQHGDGR